MACDRVEVRGRVRVSTLPLPLPLPLPLTLTRTLTLTDNPTPDPSPEPDQVACDARGDELWPAALRITLLLDADLPEQARYTLTLGVPQLELDLLGGDRPEMAARAKAAEGAAAAEGAEGGGVAAPTLRVTTCTAGGDRISGGDHAGDRISGPDDGADRISTSISRELPISREEASEALAYVRRRADELGRSWVS